MNESQWRCDRKIVLLDEDKGREKVRDLDHLRVLTSRNRSFLVDHLGNKEVIWYQKDSL